MISALAEFASLITACLKGLYMRSKTRGAIVSAFALVAFLFAASSASAALTVSPTGGYTATSGTTTLGLSSNGQSLTCSASSIGADMAADGTGTIRTGSVSYSNCRNTLLGAFTVTQAADWTLATTLASGSLTLRVTVPTDGVSLAGTGCTFWLGGTVDLVASISGLPATVRTGLVTRNSTLRITRNNGGILCFNFPVGLSAPTYGATYDFNQAATIDG